MNHRLREAVSFLRDPGKRAHALLPARGPGALERRAQWIVEGLLAVAAEHGVQLQEPLVADSKGELYVVALNPQGPLATHGCGKLGADLAVWLTKYRARTGSVPCEIQPTAGWCRIAVHDAEHLVLDYFDSGESRWRAAAQRPRPSDTPDASGFARSGTRTT